MKYSQKVCVHDSVVIALNTEKKKYLNFETSANGNTIGCVSVRCHDSKELNFFGVPRTFKCYRDRYARVISLEKLVLKEKPNIKLLVDDEGQLLAAGNTLPTNKSDHHPPINTI